MSAITSYTQLPLQNAPFLNESGQVDNIWMLFFAKLASGITQGVYNVPVSGFTFTVSPGVRNVIFNPAGVLATGTINMPASATDMQQITFTTSQTITASTFNPGAGQAIINAPTTFPAGSLSFIFSQQAGSWFKQ